MKSLPSLVWLKSFEAAARLESFSLAAEELFLTVSAVSHQIKNLESHLNTSLFIRRNRSVILTTEGHDFYKQLVPLLEEMGRVCTNIGKEKTEKNSLTLHCTPSLAVKWLGPRLGQFMSAHPQLDIHMRSSAEAPDLMYETEIDCAISYGRPPVNSKHIITEALEAEPIIPLCCPELEPVYDIKHWWLAHLPLIDSTLNPVSWIDWFGSQGLYVPVGPKLSFDRGAMAISAAVDGLGVALETIRFAEKEILNGDLVVLPSYNSGLVKRELHFLYYRNNPEVIRRVQPFKRWLLREALVIPNYFD